VKLFLPLLACAFLAGCKQQDAALLLHITGAFRIPADADKLSLDVFAGANLVTHKDWCFTTSASCAAALPGQPSLDQTLTLVQSGAAHLHIKINLELRQGPLLVGLGTNTADFQDGQTGQVSISMTRTQ
jgi:hypothetical protein